MKYSTALKQAKASIRFLSVAAPCGWALVLWVGWWWQLVAIACALTVGLTMDLVLLRKIKAGIAADPEFLKRKVPGT